jgi:hypothetical protein
MLQSSIDLDVLGTLGDWPGPSLNPAAWDGSRRGTEAALGTKDKVRGQVRLTQKGLQAPDDGRAGDGSAYE